MSIYTITTFLFKILLLVTMMAQLDDTPSTSGDSNSVPKPVHNSCESKPGIHTLYVGRDCV